MPTGRATLPDARRDAAASRPRSRSRIRPLDNSGGMGKEAGGRLPPASRVQPRRAHPIRLQRLGAPGDGPYRGDERQESAPQLVGHPLHEPSDSEGTRQPLQDEPRVSSMKEVAVALTYLEEPRQPRQEGPPVTAEKEVAVALTYLEEPRKPRQGRSRVRAEAGPRVRAVKEVAVSLTFGAPVGLALAWGYGLPGAL